MSIYRLTVTRLDDNPAYDARLAAEAAERQQRGGYGYTPPYVVAAKTETGVLDVVVTDVDWERIRAAVVEGWR